MMKELTLIGRAERVELPQLSLKKVPAKIDTGADASSIWGAGSVDEQGHLHVIFFGEGSPFYDGTTHVFPKKEYSITRVSSSFGHREIRYKLKLQIKVNGRLILGSFTLADRSKKLYPLLLGRSLLKHKFLVDVSKGKPLIAEERKRREKLQNELSTLDEEQS
jgi:hypothetical protein